MPTAYIPVISIVVGLVLTILTFVFVMPKKKDGQFGGGFGQWLHDFFHFKRLFIEDVLKFCYVLATLVCVCMGLLYLIGMDTYGYGRYTYTESTFWYGLLTLLLGPITLRFIYELGMMMVLLVSNVIEINKKMGPLNAAEHEKPVEPVAPVAPVAPAAPAAPAVGWFCPNCGSKNEGGNSFCCNCGTANPM